jgi:hypothetical protein
MLEGFTESAKERTGTAAGDRVYIVGASIAGLVLASVLARAIGTRVRVIAGPPIEGKRLIDGCSLRRSTVDVMARGLGADRARLWEALGGAPAQFYGMRISIRGGLAGGLELSAKDDAPIGLSTRHGHIVTTLRAFFDADAVLVDGRIDPERPIDGDRLRLDSTVEPLGPRDLVFNTTSRPLLPIARLPPPERFVVAAQAPLRARGGGPREAIVPSMKSDTGRQLGFVTPFADPATPDATHYVIHTAIARAERAKTERDRMLADVEAQMWKIARELDLDPIEPDATLGRAFVPVTERFAPTPSVDARVFNLHQAFSSGAPAVNVDGMLAQAVGALAFAGAFVEAGASPRCVPIALRRASRALREIRALNRFNTYSFLEMPRAIADVQARLLAPRMGKLVRDWAQLGA